jgi:hypothetical protein
MMVYLQVTVGAGLFFTFVQAINLTVSSTGGNFSSQLLYGIMFEVSVLLAIS